MRIVIDGLGSDRAPGPEIRGVVEAARAGQCEIILVGPEDDMKARLAGFKKIPDRPLGKAIARKRYLRTALGVAH